MNGSDTSVQCIRDQLAQQGSFFTLDEIEEILEQFRDASLKLIVTNVPREVYSNNLAQEAFEDLFKPLDPHATFLYLPSFNRAQVYMTNPEAALCARLQIQGWKLPESIVSQIPSELRSASNHEGINCFIDHVEPEYASEEEDESDAGSDLEVCTCSSSVIETDSDADIHKKSTCTDASPVTISDLSVIKRTQPPPVTVETVSSLDSVGDQQNRLLSERKVSSPEGENTSEASGDDVPSSIIPFINRPLAPCTVCGKQKRRQRKTKMKHLAPPKPSRLFLLSPPSSPPVGWEPKPECEPVINYDLLEALAALSPGEAFELHPSDQEHKHPSIVITPCESAAIGPRPQIVHTRCPERKS